MINLAIVGFGKWGKILVRAVQGHSNIVKFNSVVSRSFERIRDEASELNLKHLDNLAQALADPDIDGIVLATPHSLHGEQITACVNADKPVFVEKPFTLDHHTAQLILGSAPENLVVAAGHNRRFLPAVRELKTALDTGRLGQIVFVESNMSGNAARNYKNEHWRTAPEESPAGGMAGAGIHMIDLIVYLVSPIVEVVALSRRLVLNVTMDDTTSAMFVLKNGAGAALTTLTTTAPTQRLQIFGTKGSVELRGSDVLEFSDLKGTKSVRKFDAFDTELAEIEAFAIAIKGEADYPVPRCDIINGIATFEAVNVSIKENRKVTIG